MVSVIDTATLMLQHKFPFLEEGDYLALDLGGTNFHVLMCKIHGDACESLSRNYNVPKPKLYGPAVGVNHSGILNHAFIQWPSEHVLLLNNLFFPCVLWSMANIN